MNGRGSRQLRFSELGPLTPIERFITASFPRRRSLPAASSIGFIRTDAPTRVPTHHKETVDFPKLVVGAISRRAV